MNVRSNVVFVLLVAMLAGLLFLAATRERAPHAAPAVKHEEAPTDAAARTDAVAFKPDASGADTETGTPRDAGVPVLGRPMRVVALGWDMLAPGIVANGNHATGEKGAFEAANLEVHLRHADAMSDVEVQLARGGVDESGADVAIVPLPAFAAAFERLRALEPEAFLLVGWSRGHEAILGGKGASLARPRDLRPGDEVHVATGHGEAATGFALLLLDAVGISPEHVRLVNDPHGADFSAVVRPFGLESSRDTPNKLLVSTADATQAVPIVAVAPHGLIEAHGQALAAWSKAWFQGVSRLRKDVPAAARLVALESGAPEASQLLESLGLSDLALVQGNARALGLSGRSAVTLQALFQRYLRLWRGVGAITVPAPDAAPVTTNVLAAVVRSDPSLASSTPDVTQSGIASGPPLLAERIVDPKVDEPTLVDGMGFLAGVFEKAVVRVTTRNPALARSAVEASYGRFDVVQGRLVVGTAPTASAALLEVVVSP